jgi:NAD(P)-dependent dehydrogenase (short-subunit alcohol dehydrogenase family)
MQGASAKSPAAKTALITAASRIGRAIAEHFAACGARLTGHICRELPPSYR